MGVKAEEGAAFEVENPVDATVITVEAVSADGAVVIGGASPVVVAAVVAGASPTSRR
eukprot:COSAG02_NODE_39379_length_388_cov_0.438871_1_plen_56_part_10